VTASTSASTAEGGGDEDDIDMDMDQALAEEAMASQPDDDDENDGGAPVPPAPAVGVGGAPVRAAPAVGAAASSSTAPEVPPLPGQEVPPPPLPYDVAIRQARERAHELNQRGPQTYTGQPAFVEAEAYCGNCGTNQPVMDVRVRNKGQKIGRCRVCCVRVTQLSRAFGSWPHPAFKAMEPQDQIEFFQACATVHTQKDLKKLADEKFARYNNEEEFFEEGGKFLPLSVWQAQGFNTDHISQNSLPKNIKTCRVLGLVYRLPILSVGTRGASGWSRSSGARASGSIKKAKAIKDGAAEAAGGMNEDDGQEAAGDAASEDCSDSSSSSSDSSSSAGDGKKKKKKDKTKKKKEKKKKKKEHKKKKAEAKKAKEDKDRAKAEAAAKKKADKTSEAREKLASTLQQKLSPSKVSLATFVSRADFHVLPESVKTDVKALYDKADAADKDLTKVKRSKGVDELPAECATMKDCVLFDVLHNFNIKAFENKSKTKIKNQSMRT